MFVAIDGPNGVGKSSVVSAVARRLRATGSEVTTLRQPSDAEFGQYVRSAEHRLQGLSLAVLVVADRLWQMDTHVAPALSAGQTVITDRHVASTLALQRIDGLRLETLWELNADVLAPDLHVILLASADVLKQRLDTRGRTSRFERSPDIETREVELFLDASRWLLDHDQAVLTIDTDQLSVDELASLILDALGASPASAADSR